MTPRAPKRQQKGRGLPGQYGRAAAPAAPPAGGYRLAVLVGIPGSGKSSLASFLSGMGWEVVNQDTLGSREGCVGRARELLQLGQRVIIDRCNFDQSQRSTWTDLAASVSIGGEYRVAVWLDAQTDVCQERVQRRAGHRTLKPGPAAAGIVSRMARSLRPPHRNEGFHDVLRCRGERDLSEAIAILSFSPGAPFYPVRPAAREFPGNAIYDLKTSKNAWSESAAAQPPPATWTVARRHGQQPFVEPGSSTAAWSPATFAPMEEASGSGRANPPAAGGAGRGGRAQHSVASQRWALQTLPTEATTSGGTRFGRGEAQPMLSDGGYRVRGTGRAPDGSVDRNDFLFNGTGYFLGGAGRTFVPSPEAAQAYGMANAGADLSAVRSRDQPPQSRAETKLLTPADFGARYAPQPQTPSLAPENTFMGSLGSARSESGGLNASGADPPREPIVLPLNDLVSLMSRSDAPTTTGEHERDREPDSSRSREPIVALDPWALQGDLEPLTSRPDAPTTPGDHELNRKSDPSGSRNLISALDPRISRGLEGVESQGATAGAAVAVIETETSRAYDGSDITEGEAFLVLEDMFGGLLPADTLGNVYLKSGQNLEESVRQAFKLCQETWEGEELTSASDGTGSDGVTADCSSGSVGDLGGFEAWEESDELADVSEWTHEQVNALTELCLAFEDRPREQVMAVLVSSNHDPGHAAQVLLETSEAPWVLPAGASNSAAASQGGAGGRRGRQGRKKRRRTAGRRDQMRGAQPPGATAAPSLGATLGDRSRLGKGIDGGVAGAAALVEGDLTEEEGDEGLTSEEYRALATAAAEEMKIWFQRAAEAFTRGGKRHGGAAAAHPSEQGHLCERKMDALNLRAAREAFRERNPYFKVGRATDGCSVLKVFALPEPSECPIRDRLSVDLHLLRKAEALSALGAVFDALRRKRAGEAPSSQPPMPRPQARGAATTTDEDIGATYSSAVAHGPDSGGEGKAGASSTPTYIRKAFSHLEVVVGRGSHSKTGVGRLKPVVLKYVADRGFREEAVGGEQGAGVVLISLS